MPNKLKLTITAFCRIKRNYPTITICSIKLLALITVSVFLYLTTPFLKFLAVLAETSDDAIALPIFPRLYFLRVIAPTTLFLPYPSFV